VEPESVLPESLEAELLLPWSLESLPAPELLPRGPLALCVAVLSPSLCVLVDDPDGVGVVVDGLEALPPLPSAATASQAATKVASTPVVTRRRTFRTRCVTGEAGGCMPSIVADEAWILLGIRSAPRKGPPASVRLRAAAQRSAQGPSKVT
jgi:hypothetical protein